MEILTVIKYNNWILCERPSREGEKILPIQPHVPVTNQIEADLFRDGRFKRIVSAMQPILYKGVFRVGPRTAQFDPPLTPDKYNPPPPIDGPSISQHKINII